MRTFLRSFAGGEVSPELHGRVDDVRFLTGVAKAQNMVTLPHGPARKRPGSAYLTATKHSGSGSARLLPFVFSTSQAYVLEIGASGADRYIRFFQNGTPVMAIDGGAIRDYAVSLTFTDAAIDATNEIITLSSTAGFLTGDPVRITESAAAFPNTSVTPSTVVYVRVLSGTTVRIYWTSAAAVAGGLDYIPFGAPPVGTWRFSRHYVRGDLVEGTPAGSPGYFYCIQDPTFVSGAPAVPGGGVGYWHFQTGGVYEIPSVYNEANLPLVRYWQSNDVMTLAHNGHAVRTLRRYGHTNWQLVVETFTPTLSPPSAALVGAATNTGVAITFASFVATSPLRLKANSSVPFVNGEVIYGRVNTSASGLSVGFYRVGRPDGADFDVLNVDGSTLSVTGSLTGGYFKATPSYADEVNYYKVTSVDATGVESLASTEVSVTNFLSVESAYNTLSWNAVPGAARYRVYRKLLGIYGLIGTTEALTFKDDYIDVDFSELLPSFDTTLATPSPGYIEAGCYHEQRKVFARGQQLWLTRPGTETDLTYRLPSRDDDRIQFALAATEFNTIEHVVSLGSALLVLTSSAEFAVTSPDSEVLTPTSVMAQPQSFVGASYMKPVLVNNTVYYAAARGGHLRELGYQATARGFVTGDVSLRAAHLFDGYTLVDSAVMKAPYPIVLALRSDGVLLGLTSVPDQQVQGWHQHVFANGFVESIAVIPEGNEDRCYLIVRRTINGATVRHIERLAPFQVLTIADSTFLDSHKVFTNAAAGVLGGLSHLRGRSVGIIADGIVLPRQTVNASGEITLPATKAVYTKVVVGEPMEAVLRTLPIVLQIDAAAQGRRKSIGRVHVLTSNSGPFRLGPVGGTLAPSDSTAPSVRGLLVPETLRSGREPARSPNEWTDEGQIEIRDDSPLPLMVTALTLEVAVGD